MSIALETGSLIDRLPDIRGRYTTNAAIGQTSWFRCGGAADVLYKPVDEDDLAHFMRNCPPDIPITVLGVCSNVIIRDGGIRGVVIRLGRGFTDITLQEQDDALLYAGAGALDLNIALTAQKHGIAGLEFLSGIPGCFGGALRMNAGAYGTETADVLTKAHVMDRQGAITEHTPAEMDMNYRHNGLAQDVVFLGGVLRGSLGDKDEIADKIAQIKEAREGSQPVRARTGGSTFANPSVEGLRAVGLPEDRKTWQLVDAVGGRGLMIGGAQMSEKHCNFMINTGEATASDLENLGEEIRRRVNEEFGIALRWEIRRLGDQPNDA